VSAPLVIASTGPRLIEAPAAPLFAMATLAPARPAGLAAVRIRPAAGAGRVVVEVLSNPLAAALELPGTAARAVTLPRWALLELRRRHREADRVVADALGPGLRLVSLSDQAAAAVACGELAALPELPANVPTLAGSAEPLLMDPALLQAAAVALQAAAPGPIELRRLAHPVLGLELAAAAGEVAGAVLVARMVRA
jgi:hypothetical protein